jgi:bifunctional enzyme CysN/CysC
MMHVDTGHNFEDVLAFQDRTAEELGAELTVASVPSGLTTRIAFIGTYDGPIEEAPTLVSVTICHEDDIDVSRGDTICRPHSQPIVRQDIDAIVTWLHGETVLKPGAKFAIKHTTRWTRALVEDLHYRFDVNTLHRDESATQLGLNEIGRVKLRSTAPLYFDEYRRNRATGSFILFGEHPNVTVDAGIISGESQ